MNVYLFRDGDGDFVIVTAVSLASAEGLLDRAAVNGDTSVFTNATRVHVPVDGSGSAPDVNTYSLQQKVLDANTTSERILFEID